MFLVLGATLGFILAVLIPPLTPRADLNPLGLLLGFAVSWPIASLPIYYWRWRLWDMRTPYSDTPLTDSARRHGYR
jgi:hypothetical protein